MDDDQFDLFMTVLIRIADSLERIAPTASKAPNYQYPIEDFPNFDWSSINAEVKGCDQYGPAVVMWGGQTWLRRSPQNKFGAAIWFSRSTGEKDSEGKPVYERLITFKSVSDNVEPIPQKVTNIINHNHHPRTPA